MITPILFTDFYKTDHRRQYPHGTTLVYSNLTPRTSRIDGVDAVVVFGIQYFIKDYLIRRFNEGFFKKDKKEVIAAYKRRTDNALGPDAFPLDHLEKLHDLGYLPIKIKVLPEGSLCPLRVPFLTIQNTKPEFFWITNFLETIMCNVLWGAVNSATIAHQYRKILDEYADKTSDIPEFVQWQGHDFSMRGMFGLEASLISGMAHLISFTGTDTIPAIDALENFYGANSEKELIGGSVPATEHSVMCMGGKCDELATYRRLLTEVYPKGIVSIVSDTWDYWKVFSEIIPQLKNEIMQRDGKFVVRPDSGNPVEIICGTDNKKGSIELLWDIFGGTVNSKGYKQLDPHIGLIYGDSITIDICKQICSGLEEKRLASTNVVFGIGSYTYQYNTRDTLGFAMKSTYGEIDGVGVEIFKDPITDSGVKKSAKGLLRVNSDLTLSEGVSRTEENKGLLETVFLDGVLIKDQKLSEIRKRLNES
ncbi:putative nicotinate phosphoribosyltransferase [Caudoviricetes sp.]|nr:putative nicotinate phosphoribosyltransferase [Caudoviricetes sp.]UOF80982.1 putative nicotinate phosphoribosyltransferase [Caudoviricetes sp.]UOF81371.1 putative nicotinate phosphoribosyltransferase [Caudoviricetes sp.]